MSIVNPSISDAHDFDVSANETPLQSHATYEELRRKCPVAHTQDMTGFWALTRHADVARAAADHTTFTTTVQNVIPKVAFTGRRPPLHLDPPEQTPYRAALNPLLSAERVQALAKPMQSIIEQEWQPLLAAGRGDICAAFSARFPVRIFGLWMNLDGALLEQLMQAGPAFIRAVQAFDNSAMKDTSLVLYDMARALIAQRHAQPQDPTRDPVSALLAVRQTVNGQPTPLPDEMVVGTVRQVLVVGIVAPMVMVGSMAMHLAQHPALLAQLREKPHRLDAAVEEFLRLYSPYRGFARTPKQDVCLHGRQILAGEPIALTYASANRDESVFPNPHEFEWDRPNLSDHLAFGRGPHFCAGAHLARLELKLALQTITQTVQSIRVTGPVQYCPYPEIGPYQVPVELVPI
jgi:cytochrome P450